MRGTRQPHKSAPGIFTMFDILYVYNHTDPVVLVLYPGHVTYERSDVAFLLMDPDPEMPGSVFSLLHSTLPQPL